MPVQLLFSIVSSKSFKYTAKIKQDKLQPCFIPVLAMNAVDLRLLYFIYDFVLLYIDFIMLKKFPFTPLSSSFVNIE